MPRKGQTEALASVMARTGESLLLVGDTAMDIAVSVLLLVIVGRVYGPGGLGIYSFLLSVFVIISFVSEFGIEKWIEKEVASGKHGDRKLLGDARAAILLSGLLGCLITLIVTAQAMGSTTVAGRASAGLWLIAVAVPLRLYSGFQISVLNASGRYVDAVWTGFKGRIVLLLSVLVLSFYGLRPDLLSAGFLFSEAASVVFAWRRSGLSAAHSARSRIPDIVDVFKNSVRYYFTHEGLKILFFVDFFILGFFVTSSQEGLYAEASVLARFFLLVPLGAAPLYRVRVYRDTDAEYGQIFEASRLTAARMFTVHSVIALVFLLYFPEVLKTVFRLQGDVPVFFRVFSLLLPGLLLFSSTVVLEPFFMVGGLERELNGIALRVFLLNALLNSYLIPYSGIFGAAIATTVSLVVYFLLFMNRISLKAAVPVGTYFVGGGLIYLGYHFLNAVDLAPILVIPIVAVVLPLLFWGLGLFDQGAPAVAKAEADKGRCIDGVEE